MYARKNRRKTKEHFPVDLHSRSCSFNICCRVLTNYDNFIIFNNTIDLSMVACQMCNKSNSQYVVPSRRSKPMAQVRMSRRCRQKSLWYRRTYRPICKRRDERMKEIRKQKSRLHLSSSIRVCAGLLVVITACREIVFRRCKIRRSMISPVRW
jgi:hypothetical protein